MKNLILSALLLLAATTAAAQTYRYMGPSGDEQTIDITVVGEAPSAEYYKFINDATLKRMWPGGLQMRLDSLLNDTLLQSTQLGLMVYDLTDDKCLYKYNERQMLRPASTMKLLTSITALHRLGCDYTYKTRLFLAGTISDGTLQGDIYCVGGLDPMFSRADMGTLADKIKAMGVKKIRGRIISDKTMRDPEEKYGEGWCWDDDNPTLSPLLVERKDNFAGMLTVALKKAKIDTKVTYATGELPQGDVTQLCSIERPVTEVLHDMMKESDNLYAESMFYQLAANDGKRPARAKDAAEQVSHLIDSIMPYAPTYRIADGSGLSLYNYVTAEIETMLLRHAYKNEKLYATLREALPIAGVDGTIKKRMTDSPAFANVRAKTGTLTGISSLAGYCTASNGHTLCFTIINQGVMRGRPARDFQDKACRLMCDPYDK